MDLSVLMISVRADYGGGPEHVFRLMQYLPDNIKPWVACPREVPYWERYARLIGEERMIEMPHRKFRISYLFALRKLLIKNKINIIHSHGKGAGVYGRLLALFTGRPCIHTFHGLHIGEYNSIQRALYLMIERILSKLSRQIIAVSAGEAEVIKSEKLCDPKKLTIIENGVVIPSETVCLQSVGKYKIVLITRFDYSKNTELLIPILKALELNNQINKFQFNILGTGKNQKLLETEIEKLGLSPYVSFYGSVANPNEYFKKAFCYLSTSRWEGLPLSLLEAMAVGLPVVATNVVGNRDIVDNGENGYLFELDAPESAARLLVQLVDDLERWTNFSKAARYKVCTSYSIEQMSAKIAELYLKARNNKSVI